MCCDPWPAPPLPLSQSIVMAPPALLTDREMRILSLLTIAALSLVVVCSTWMHAQSVNSDPAAEPLAGALLEHQAQPALSTTQLHPAILPVLALAGRTLHAPAGPQQQTPSAAQNDAAASSSSAPPAIPLPSRLLRKLSTGAGVQFAPQQSARPMPGSQSALVPLPLPLPMPAPQAIPAGHPRPCFRDC